MNAKRARLWVAGGAAAVAVIVYSAVTPAQSHHTEAPSVSPAATRGDSRGAATSPTSSTTPACDPAQCRTPRTSPAVSSWRSWPVPNRRLTPGAVVACTLPRPASQRDVPESEKDQVAAAYRYSGPRGLTHLEFDHLIPFSLCGANDARNIWPEPVDGVTQSAFVHNRKDQLEDVIARMVRFGDMTLSQGQAVFRVDWRRQWCRFVHAPGVDCAGA